MKRSAPIISRYGSKWIYECASKAASVKGAKLVDSYRHIALAREVGNGLAEVAVIVDDLLYGESLLKQLPFVTRRGFADLRQDRFATAGWT